MASSKEISKIRNSYGENARLGSIPAGIPAINCKNGTFVGNLKGKVEEYLGVPFARQPVGELRWKKPEPVPGSNGIFTAFYNGKSPIQTEWDTEMASFYPQGEDCLYLNIWMSTQPNFYTKRPVMVFFHGGAYGWGGTADPIYNGVNFAAAHPEIILITAGYRTGIMGFVDLSYLEGGEDFPDAPNLGLLDQIEALRWVQKNCALFGGDPENVTIFGESAGGGSVSLLPIIPEAKGLFRRVIAESGSVALTFSKEQCRTFTEKLMEVSGARSMNELMALSAEELAEINKPINEFNNFPMRDGKLIPLDPYESYRNGASADIDMLIGTNEDEMNYWIGEVGGIINFRYGIPVKFENDIRDFSIRDKARVNEFMQTRGRHSLWRMSEFYTEMMFRLPAVLQAGEHSRNGGKAYMYLWKKPSAIRYYGSCHAVELAYVFRNTDVTIYTGSPADEGIADMVGQMWVNFAMTGDPSIEWLKWPEYDKKNRYTMVISDESHVTGDPAKSNRTLLYPLLKYRINTSYTDLDLKVPFTFRTVGIGLLAALGLVAGGVTAVYLANRKK